MTYLHEEKRCDPVLELSALRDAFEESSVLGTLLPEDFTEKEYCEIFKVYQECFSENGSLELPHVCFKMNGRAWWDTIGGSAWFCEILTRQIPYAYWQSTCRSLREYTIIRLQEQLKLGHGAAEKNIEELEKARDIWLGLMPSQAKSAVDFKKILSEPDKSGILSGFPGVDRMTNGMVGGQLIVVGARTGVGKSVYLMNVAQSATGEGKSVLWLALEMSEKEVLKRFMKLLSEGKTEHVDSMDYIKTMDLISGSKSLAQLEAEVSKKHYDLVIVDYLQLLRSGRDFDTEVQELQEITRRLKLLAMKQDTIVLAAAQLNRESDKQARVPRLSDLRGSGSIEQDSDVVILIHRIMREDAPAKNNFSSVDAAARSFTGQGDTDVFVEKNRNGNTGIVNMRFDSKQLRFIDLTSISPVPHAMYM